MHQTNIHSLIITISNNAASTSIQILKVTKSISRVSSIYLSRRSISLSHRTDILSRCYEWQVYSLLSRPLASICHVNWSDVTKRWRYLVGRSDLYTSGIKRFAEVSYCLRRFFQLSGGLQHAIITLTSFLRTSWHGFPVIKPEKSILFDVFSRHYDTAKWIR